MDHTNALPGYEAPDVAVLGSLAGLTEDKKAHQSDFNGAGETDGYFPSDFQPRGSGGR